MSRVRGPSLCAALAIAAVVLATAGGPSAAATPDLRTLFPNQAELFVDGEGLSRLELPPAVISACRGDLSDLRVFDVDGREVPYLVDGGLPATARVEVRQSLVPEILEVAHDRFERPDGGVSTRETYELAAPPEASATGFWDLVVEARPSSFVRRLEVAAKDAGGELTPIAQGSVFRLRDPSREKLRVTLPAFVAERLVVTLEGEDGGYLEPAFRFDSARTLPARARATVRLEVLSRDVWDRRTRVQVARPRGLVPDALILATSTAAFNRRVEVWDEGPGAVAEASRQGRANGTLGTAVLFRVPAAATVEELEIPLLRPRGDRLRLVIADGDSPPLEDLAISVVVRRPALIFALPAGEPAGMLRFGGGRAYRPRYDLAALLPSLPATGDDAELAERLYDPAQLGEVRIGQVTANPDFDRAPVLAFAHLAGSEIDGRLFRYRRRLEVEPSAEGLSRLKLTAEDLAVARADLADLRIVDQAPGTEAEANPRQWAYLLERGRASDLRTLEAAAPETEDGTSSYALALPVTPVNVEQIVLETSAPFFDRAYQLTATRDGQRITLARGRLARRIGDQRPVEIAFAAHRVDALELRVEDGDDAPLPLDRIRARLPVAELYFAAPAGDYALLLGHPEGRAPRYELARVRDLVLAVASSQAAAGALEDNPDYRPRGRLATEQGLQRLALWLVLGTAVVVLALLTLRLARRDPAGADE